MRTYTGLGTAPADEVPTGTRREALRYLEEIIDRVGVPPQGADLDIHREPGGDGGYWDVVVNVDEDSPDAIVYAQEVDNNAPANWLPEPYGYVYRMAVLGGMGIKYVRLMTAHHAEGPQSGHWTRLPIREGNTERGDVRIPADAYEAFKAGRDVLGKWSEHTVMLTREPR